MIGRYTWRTLVLEVGLILVALIYLLPAFGLINISLKAPNNSSGPLEVAGNYTFANYGLAWHDGHLGPALSNSAFIAIVGVVLVVVVGALAAYPLARISRRWSTVVFYLFLIGLVLPGQIGLLPLFRQMQDLGLVGSVWSIIFIAVGGGMPFSVFLFTAFLRQLPREYEEAAVIDGCGPVRVFIYIVLPLLRPAIGTVAILSALAIWNDFFTPLLYLSGSANETVPIRILGFVGEYFTNYPAIFAALAITSLPILVMFLALQRSVIQGFSGGLKG